MGHACHTIHEHVVNIEFILPPFSDSSFFFLFCGELWNPTVSRPQQTMTYANRKMSIASIDIEKDKYFCAGVYKFDVICQIQVLQGRNFLNIQAYSNFAIDRAYCMCLFTR